MAGTRPPVQPAQQRGSLHGFGPTELRALELHEARAHARADRRAADLGDAILLHDPTEADPFLNRLSGLRLPGDATGFDRRLGELLTLFATLGRRPHLLLSPAFETPPDLASRLAEIGFVDVGGTFEMIQVRRSRAAATTPPPGAAFCIRRLAAAGRGRSELIDAIGGVLVDAFGADTETAALIAADLDRTSFADGDACLLSVDDVPVAAGRRYTADGATYLSSIGTRSGHRRRGYASVVTSALIADGRAAGGSVVHLGVESTNEGAQAVYRRLGFEVVGARQADLLLV